METLTISAETCSSEDLSFLLESFQENTGITKLTFICRGLVQLMDTLDGNYCRALLSVVLFSLKSELIAMLNSNAGIIKYCEPRQLY
jgi:hypothetical protein